MADSGRGKHVEAEFRELPGGAEPVGWAFRRCVRPRRNGSSKPSIAQPLLELCRYAELEPRQTCVQVGRRVAAAANGR